MIVISLPFHSLILFQLEVMFCHIKRVYRWCRLYRSLIIQWHTLNRIWILSHSSHEEWNWFNEQHKHFAFLLCFEALVHRILLTHYKYCWFYLKRVLDTIYENESELWMSHLVYLCCHEMRGGIYWKTVKCFFSFFLKLFLLRIEWMFL